MRRALCLLMSVAVLASFPRASAGGGKGSAHPSAPHVARPPQPHFSVPKPPPHHNAAGLPSHSTASQPQPHHVTSAMPHKDSGTSPLEPSLFPGGTNPLHPNLFPQGINPLSGMLGPTPLPNHAVGSYHHAAGSYHHGHACSYGSGYRRPIRSNGTAWQQARLWRLRKLKADLDAIAPGATVSQGRRSTLQHDLMAVAQGRVKPPMPPVQQLARDLAVALAGRSRPAVNTTRFTLALEEVMNANQLSPPVLGGAIDGGVSILKAAGVPPHELRVVSQDIQAVALGQLP
jgi:hypothetical protein